MNAVGLFTYRLQGNRILEYSATLVKLLLSTGVAFFLEASIWFASNVYRRVMFTFSSSGLKTVSSKALKQP